VSISRATAWAFLAGGLVYCLVTDGNGPGDITTENLGRMKWALSERLGDGRARLLVEENPSRVWEREPLERLSPGRIRGRKPGGDGSNGIETWNNDPSDRKDCDQRSDVLAGLLDV